MINKEIVINKLNSLSRSSFRTKFKLSNKDKAYILDNGIDKIIMHAYDFVNNRLASKELLNDGKQTPMRGHPVFVAQHATGTCCRGCLCKCHGIAKDKQLTSNEVNYIVSIIIEWIVREMKK